MPLQFGRARLLEILEFKVLFHAANTPQLAQPCAVLNIDYDTASLAVSDQMLRLEQMPAPAQLGSNNANTASEASDDRTQYTSLQTDSESLQSQDENELPLSTITEERASWDSDATSSKSESQTTRQRSPDELMTPKKARAASAAQEESCSTAGPESDQLQGKAHSAQGPHFCFQPAPDSDRDALPSEVLPNPPPAQSLLQDPDAATNWHTSSGSLRTLPGQQSSNGDSKFSSLAGPNSALATSPEATFQPPVAMKVCAGSEAKQRTALFPAADSELPHTQSVFGAGGSSGQQIDQISGNEKEKSAVIFPKPSSTSDRLPEPEFTEEQEFVQKYGQTAAEIQAPSSAEVSATYQKQEPLSPETSEGIRPSSVTPGAMLEARDQIAASNLALPKRQEHDDFEMDGGGNVLKYESEEDDGSEEESDEESYNIKPPPQAPVEFHASKLFQDYAALYTPVRKLGVQKRRSQSPTQQLDSQMQNAAVIPELGNTARCLQVSRAELDTSLDSASPEQSR